MKNWIAIATGLTLAFGSLPAAAEGYRDYHERRGESRHERYSDYRGHRDGYRDGYRGRDFRPRPHWERGHTFPHGHRHELIRHYRSYHLNRPPRGHHWVRVDNEYLLVANGSGVIADIVVFGR